MKKHFILFLKGLINLLHLNIWEYYDYVEDPWFYDSIGPYYRRRKCKLTGLTQVRFSHCLGVNPPEYRISWKSF